MQKLLILSFYSAVILIDVLFPFSAGAIIGRVESQPKDPIKCANLFNQATGKGQIESQFDAIPFPRLDYGTKSDHANCLLSSGCSSVTLLPFGLYVENKVLLDNWAQTVLKTPRPSPVDVTIAKIILRKFRIDSNGQPIDTDVQNALKKVALHKRADVLATINNQDSSAKQIDIALAEMGLVSHADMMEFSEDIGAADQNPTMDEVMAASQRGNLTWEFGRTKSGRVRANEILDSRLSGSKDLMPLGQDPISQLSANLSQQINHSRLFLGFGREDFFGGSEHYLKIKPMESWSTSSLRAMLQIFKSQGLSLMQIEKIFSGNWLIGCFMSDQMGHLEGAIAFDFLPSRAFSINMGGRPNAKAPSLNYISEIWNSTNSQMGDSYGFGLNGVLAQYGIKVLVTEKLMGGLKVSRSSMSSGFAIPQDIIDWNQSVFSINLTRAIPSTSLALRYHSVSMLVSNLGNEVIVTGMSSGRLTKAAQTSKIAKAMPFAWSEVPKTFRRIPATTDEVNSYVNWLEQQNFLIGGLLPQSNDPRIGDLKRLSR